MDADVGHPPPPPSTLDTDDSLRVAALLSRKRRRVAAGAPALPPHPVPEPTLQLDYGGVDPAAVQPGPRFSPPSGPTDHIEDIEDGQIREEGEISDTEASPTPSPKLRPRPFSSPSQESARIEHSLAPRPPSHTEASPIESPGAQSWQAASLEPFVLETSTYRLDADHVRPGLTMTLDQYNTAKDIVLDLLGWGVPPEYLLECGLSRHVIFYVFSELNLRLPSNLDTSGLIPYPTPEMRTLMPISPSPSMRSLHSSSSTIPPSVIPARVSLAERMSMERIDTRMSSPDSTPYIKAEPSSPSSADLSHSHSLLMIEQQRRQELLARKAVIASRKARQSEPLGFVTSRDQDTDTSAAHAQSVDDFLKTIGPAPLRDVGNDNARNQRSSIGTNSFSSLERMDVDDLIPGLVGGSRDTSASSPPSPSQPQSLSVTVLHTESRLPTALPARSTDSTGFTNNAMERGSVAPADPTDPSSHTPTLQSNLSYASLDGDRGYPQRRGVKRPVAADFVDYDSGPGSSHGVGSSSSNGQSNGGPLSRRKASSFAGISSMRRCVIELSDSEDDGDSQVMGDQLGNGDTREYSPTVTTVRVPSRLTGTPTVTSSLGLSVVANGNTAQPLPPVSATSALAEKEEEIKRMRRLIAQREELRLKKLATMSGKSTPIIPPTIDIPTWESAVTVKQDEGFSLVGHNNVSRLPPLRDRENHVSILESTRRHDSGIFVAVADAKSGPATSHTSATVRTLGMPGPNGSRSDLSAPKTPAIGRDMQDGDSDDEQDLLITGETHTGQVVLPSKEDIHQDSLAAGDSGASSSAQVLRSQMQQSRNEAPPPSSRSGFPLYDSPLSRYPLLRPRSGPDTGAGNSCLVTLPSKITSASQASARSTSPAGVHFPSPISYGTGAVPPHPCSPITLPDLKELKHAVLHRWLARMTRRSPDLRVCPYEVPGGGVCRDKDCGELHLSQMNKEPSDTEVAAYVHGSLPRPWNVRCDVRAIEIALEGVRLRGSAMDVDGRVREALGGLGIPMT